MEIFLKPNMSTNRVIKCNEMLA